MTSTVPFKLITPSAVAFEGEAELVIATGTEGEIGILPKHANVQENGGTKRLELATGEGFLQALPDRITMIVDAAVGGDAVDRNATRDELNAAVERQKAAGSDSAAWRREQVAIDFANAKLRASGGAG
jgi:F-type H+-transporting ATPase subunit epsilon